LSVRWLRCGTTGVRVVVSLGCSGGGGPVYTARRRTAAATGMDFGFDLGAAAVAARRAAGVRLCGRARQRCNPCTHPHRRLHTTTPPYSSSRPPPPPPPFARPSECVRVRCPCGRVPPRPTRRAALSGRKPPNIAVKRARTRVARSAASYIPRRRRVSYTGYRSSGAAPPPFNRARSLAHTNEHPHTHTHTHTHSRIVYRKCIYSCGTAFV